MNILLWLAYVGATFYFAAKFLRESESAIKKAIVVLIALGSLYYATDHLLLHPPHFDNSDPIKE
jgi:hypothetical protein